MPLSSKAVNRSPRPASAAPNWAAVLDEIEWRLGQYRASLTGGELPPPYHLPKNLGPIPSELQARARDLLEQHHGIEAALEARRARLGAAIARRARLAEEAGVPAFLDARA